MLLAQRLITIYKDSDWRAERLSGFIVWMNSPAVIFGLWMEAEAVQSFELHYELHAGRGELSDVPNFRSLELYRPIMRQSFPHWHATLQNPAYGFPNTRGGGAEGDGTLHR